MTSDGYSNRSNLVSAVKFENTISSSDFFCIQFEYPSKTFSHFQVILMQCLLVEEALITIMVDCFTEISH